MIGKIDSNDSIDSDFKNNSMKLKSKNLDLSSSSKGMSILEKSSKKSTFKKHREYRNIDESIGKDSNREDKGFEEK